MWGGDSIYLVHLHLNGLLFDKWDRTIDCRGKELHCSCPARRQISNSRKEGPKEQSGSRIPTSRSCVCRVVPRVLRFFLLYIFLFFFFLCFWYTGPQRSPFLLKRTNHFLVTLNQHFRRTVIHMYTPNKIHRLQTPTILMSHIVILNSTELRYFNWKSLAILHIRGHLISEPKQFLLWEPGIETYNVQVNRECITEETPEVIIIFPTLWKRMGLADTLTGQSNVPRFPASLWLYVIRSYVYKLLP